MTEYQKQYREYMWKREWFNMLLGNAVLFTGWNETADAAYYASLA